MKKFYRRKNEINRIVYESYDNYHIRGLYFYMNNSLEDSYNNIRDTGNSDFSQKPYYFNFYMKKHMRTII